MTEANNIFHAWENIFLRSRMGDCHRLTDAELLAAIWNFTAIYDLNWELVFFVSILRVESISLFLIPRKMRSRIEASMLGRQIRSFVPEAARIVIFSRELSRHSYIYRGNPTPLPVERQHSFYDPHGFIANFIGWHRFAQESASWKLLHRNICTSFSRPLVY